MVGQITLYTTETSPWAQRVKIALDEVGAEYETYIVDLRNRPEWFPKLVNPANKVPAITYGGPSVPPSEPHASSFKLGESSIIVEFIADLFPSSSLLPQDPVQRAQIRSFVDYVATKFQPACSGVLFRGAAVEPVLECAEFVQRLLESAATGNKDDNEPFLLGDKFTLAEVNVAPALIRLYTLLEAGVTHREGVGEKLLENLRDESRFGRFSKWAKAVCERETVKRSFPVDAVVAGSRQAIENIKAKEAQSQNPN